MDKEKKTSGNENRRAEIWNDDVLNRSGYADFLTQTLSEQTRAVSKLQRGLTVTIDAGWGTGKTFFVRHWAEDLKQQNHPVVFFDAWENDLGEEAAIALMAAIKETVDEWIALMPAKQKMMARADEMVRDGVKSLRKAMWPASKVIANAVLKKTTGIVVKEVFDAFDDEEPSTESDEEPSQEKIEASLDKIFEGALAGQKRRSEAIRDFKASISNALKVIDENTGAKLPAFVFVDELDRCRPSYAIQLLEEIKHIFGMPWVCFIVSTNLEQLSHSTRAVYGGGFDANGYLKRFFDQGFVLPEPDHEKHVLVLMEATTALKERELSLGLPVRHGPKLNRTPAYAISLVFSAFDLDLRSQKQIFLTADLVASSIEKDKKIFLLWLFFLCALFHRKPESFNLLLSRPGDFKLFTEIINNENNHRNKIEALEIDSYGRVSGSKLVGLNDVISQYFLWSNQDLEKISERANEEEYPSSNGHDLILEIPNPRYTNKKYYPSIAKYLALIKYAGYSRSNAFD